MRRNSSEKDTEFRRLFVRYNPRGDGIVGLDDNVRNNVNPRRIQKIDTFHLSAGKLTLKRHYNSHIAGTMPTSHMTWQNKQWSWFYDEVFRFIVRAIENSETDLTNANLLLEFVRVDILFLSWIKNEVATLAFRNRPSRLTEFVIFP